MGIVQRNRDRRPRRRGRDRQPEVPGRRSPPPSLQGPLALAQAPALSRSQSLKRQSLSYLSLSVSLFVALSSSLFVVPSFFLDLSFSEPLSCSLSLSLVGMFDNYRNLLCVLHGSESQAAYTAYCDSDSSTGMLCGNRLLPGFVRASVGSHRGALSRQAGAGLPWRCGQC